MSTPSKDATIKEIIDYITDAYPLNLQEDYDNSGLQIGNLDATCKGILVCLDVTEEVMQEAWDKQCNFIISHHPLLFNPIKSISSGNATSDIIINAINKNISIFSVHTNIDNNLECINSPFKDIFSLQNCLPLIPKRHLYSKLITFVPDLHIEKVRDALFQVGAGQIGNYSECSFASKGTGTFLPHQTDSNPFVGEKGERHFEQEQKLELIFPCHLKQKVVHVLRSVHPYEEPAYDIIAIDYEDAKLGGGIIGNLEKSMDSQDFLKILKKSFDLSVIKHSKIVRRTIKKVAACGGAGAFMLPYALKQGADIFITSDIKYNYFFETNSKIILADIGHYESEILGMKNVVKALKEKLINFDVFFTEYNTNPIQFF